MMGLGAGAGSVLATLFWLNVFTRYLRRRTDALRQPLQVIRSEAHNIKTRLEQLKEQDPDITEAQAAIDRGIERLKDAER